MSPPARFLLVHGAWHGAWCWAPLLERLRAAGRQADAIDLPGRRGPDHERARLRLDDYAAAVAAAVSAQPGPVLLVGHSLGGMAITQAAEQVPERISQLVYLAAFLPRDGERVADLLSDSFRAESLIARHQEIDRAAGVSRLPAAVAREALYGTCAPDVAAAAIARLVPEALGPQADRVHITPERGGGAPRSYVETLQDRVVPLATQREMQAAAGVDAVLTVDSDHSPSLSAPDALCAALLELAGRTTGAPQPSSDRTRRR